MEQNYSLIRKIKYAGITVGIINLFASMAYIFLFIVLSIFSTSEFQDITTQLIIRLLIIALVLIIFGVAQILFSSLTNGNNIVEHQVIIFLLYGLILPIILLFGAWPLTVIHSLINFLYGLLIAFLIFKEKNKSSLGVYY